MAESLGGARALYPHWRYGAAVVWRLHVVSDRIRAPALSLLKGGVSAGGVLLEFRGEEMVVISPVNTQGSLLCLEATHTIALLHLGAQEPLFYLLEIHEYPRKVGQ